MIAEQQPGQGEQQPGQAVPHRDINQEDMGSRLHNPIKVYDDDEEKVLFSRHLEEARKAALIKSAILCNNSMDLVLAIVKSKLTGDLKFREQVLRKEVVNYFNAKVGIDLTSDFFEPKLEANYDNPEIIPTGISLVVHGVDFMDTRKVGDLFSIVGQDPRSFVHKIVWINDSNCEVIFFNPQNAMLALEQLMVDPNQYKLKVEEEGGIQLPREWFELKPYDIFGVKRKLFVRHGTVAELNLEKGQILNRYLCFDSAKRGIELHLLQHFKGVREYEEITKQIQFDKYKKTIFKSQRYSYIQRDLTDSKPFHDYVTLNRGPTTRRRESNHVDIEQGFINALDVSVIEPELPNSGLQKSVFQPKANEDELVEVCLDNSVIVAGNDMLDESEEMKLPVVQDFIVQDCVESIPLLNQDVVNMLAASKKDDKIGEVERKIEKMQISSSNVSVNINEAERRQIRSSNVSVNTNEAEERKSLPEVELRQPTSTNSTVRASEAPSPSLIKLPPTPPPAAKPQTESKKETPAAKAPAPIVKKPYVAPKKSSKPADDDQYSY